MPVYFERNPQLETTISKLESSGLIRLAQLEPELEYLFRHALVQEAVYQSLLKSDRRILHGVVANALEDLFEDQVDEVAPILALHCEEMGDDEKALHYFTMSGDLMTKVYANAEAAFHYTRALEIAVRVDKGIEVLQPLFISRGRALELSGQHEKALENYVQLGYLASNNNDQSLFLQSLLSQIVIYSTPTAIYDRGVALQLSEQALDLARNLKDPPAEARLLWSMALLNLYSGQEDQFKAITFGQQSADIARAAGLEEQLAYSLTDLGRAYSFIRQMREALPILTEAEMLWHKTSNSPMLVDTMTQLALLFMNVGDYPAARLKFDHALALSLSSNNVWGQTLIQMYVSLLYLELGDINSAIDKIEEAIRQSPKAGFVGPQVGGRVILAMIYLSLGAIEIGIEACHLAIKHVEVLLHWRPWVNAVLIQLHLQQNNLPAAQRIAGLKILNLNEIINGGTSTIDQAMIILSHGELALLEHKYEYTIELMKSSVDEWQANGITLYLPDMLYLKGKALYAQGKKEDAHKDFESAREQAEKSGANRILWRILATLANIAEENGASTEAESLRQKSREIISLIASLCPADLQEIFLQMPDVRKVVRG